MQKQDIGSDEDTVVIQYCLSLDIKLDLPRGVEVQYWGHGRDDIPWFEQIDENGVGTGIFYEGFDEEITDVMSFER